MTDFENGQATAARGAHAQADEPMISIRDFNLWYGDFQALKGVTLDIPKNRATAFIGPSGCGKSTLLRTFNRMCDFVPTVRTEGTIEVAGRDIFGGDANELRVRVGMVFQHPNPFPMSIRDNILYGPRRMRRLGRAEADELVERCLRDAGLWDEVRDKLGQSGLGLSGGQQQRLCIARLGHAARDAAHGRTHERARPHLHGARRGADGAACPGAHRGGGHAQHAAGYAGGRQDGLLLPGRAGGIRAYQAAVRQPRAAEDERLSDRKVQLMKTRTRYINKLEELGALVNQLSEKTVLDVRAAGRALAGDADAAEGVLSGSKAARRLREAIEDGCLDIMLMQQPLVADDLREVTGAFRLVSDLAHIDEMTCDVAYLSQQLTPKAVSHLQSEFADAADKVSKMVSLAAKAFSQADAALAQRVFAMDDGVDELYDRCEQVVVDLIRSETQGASHLPELLMVAKYFERMGDDAERIASWAVFRATGEHALNSAGKENAEE